MVLVKKPREGEERRRCLAVIETIFDLFGSCPEGRKY